MFSLVFVSVKLSGEHGNHLPPSAFPGGETLLADGFSPGSQNSHRVTFWLLDPSAWGPQTPLLPLGGEWAHKLLDRFLVLPGRGADGDDRVLGLLSRSLLTPGLWPSSHPLGKPDSLTLSQSLMGLIQTKSQQAFAFLSFITFILI